MKRRSGKRGKVVTNRQLAGKPKRQIPRPLDVFTKPKPKRREVIDRNDVFVPLKRDPRPAPPPGEDAAETDRVGASNIQALWGCEPADPRSFQQLLPEGETPLAFQARRNVKADPQCPEYIPVSRRRCWRCPFWTRHPELNPF